MNQRGRTGFVFAFLAPAVALYSLFVVWPLIQTFQLSVYRYKGLSANKTFNGADNYQWLFVNKVFWLTLKNNAFLLIVGGAAILAISVSLAHAMSHKSKLSQVMRGVFLFPQIISVVVVAVIWQFMYNPNHGLVNATLDRFGMASLKHGWLAEKATSLPAVTLVFVWWALGFYVMLFSAGLQSIPEEIQEAAKLDGANGLRKFWKVTWPMLWSMKRVAGIYLLSMVLNVFALVYVMTSGGPDRATETMLTFLYQTGFEQSNYGRASALATTNFVLALLLSALLFALMRRNPEEARR